MITDRDAGILLLLADLRFMTTSQIHKIYGYRGNYGLKVTRRKLCDLESRGFIRSWRPSNYEQKIFYLTKAGAREVEYFFRNERVPTYRKTEKTMHQVFVSEVYVQLKSESSGELTQFTLNKKVGFCIPDAHIIYNTTQQYLEFYLEVDRETESIAYLRDTKLDNYRRLFESPGLTGPNASVVILTLSEYRKSVLSALKRHITFPVQIYTFQEFSADPLILCKGPAVSESLSISPIS